VGSYCSWKFNSTKKFSNQKPQRGSLFIEKEIGRQGSGGASRAANRRETVYVTNLFYTPTPKIYSFQISFKTLILAANKPSKNP